MSTTDPLNPEELTRGKTLDEFCVGPTHEVAAIGGEPRGSAHRVAGGSWPPPAPTERSMRICSTTLFDS